jgi:asparagine synthetase B (glutamine-hydrolysing)
MAWGLEARVPFLDKAFLEVALNIDPKEKMFTKGANIETDEDGKPKMEKVCKSSTGFSLNLIIPSTFFAKLSTAP